MEEDKNLSDVIDAYDAADRPFDFVEDGAQTAIVCEDDTTARDKISAALQDLGYRITEAASAREALKKMRFHVYDVVVLNETFAEETAGAGEILEHLQGLPMAVRRRMFVALISGKFRTMDNMAAFNRSVNLVINPLNLNDVAAVIRLGAADNDGFYRVFRELLKKTGRA